MTGWLVEDGRQAGCKPFADDPSPSTGIPRSQVEVEAMR